MGPRYWETKKRILDLQAPQKYRRLQAIMATVPVIRALRPMFDARNFIVSLELNFLTFFRNYFSVLRVTSQRRRRHPSCKRRADRDGGAFATDQAALAAALETFERLGAAGFC